jgi:sarcosine oxidase subunit delta
MKMINCPLNGPRNISEFIYGGEVKTMPDPQTCTDKAWADYVFYTENTIRVVREWWYHAASGYWFIAERHTGSDDILRTFDPAEIFDKRIDFAHRLQTGEVK